MLKLFVAISIEAADDSRLGRLEYSTMSQQALMELAVQDIGSKMRFMDKNGHFLDVSEWPGLEFNVYNDIIGLSWGYDRHFNRVCTAGSINMQWLPTTIQSLSFDGCGLSEKIDFSMLPLDLQKFRGMSNNFSGSISTAQFPQKLATLCLDACQMSSSIDLSQLPKEFVSFRVAENRLSGPLDLQKLPSTLVELSLSKNQLSGSLCLRYLPDPLECLRLDGNSFSGSVHLARLPSRLAELDLGCNSLSGSIHLTRLPNSMKELYIQEKLLFGIIHHAFTSTRNQVYLRF